MRYLCKSIPGTFNWEKSVLYSTAASGEIPLLLEALFLQLFYLVVTFLPLFYLFTFDSCERARACQIYEKTFQLLQVKRTHIT